MQKISIIVIVILGFLFAFIFPVEQVEANDNIRIQIRGSIKAKDGDSFEEYNKSGFHKEYRIAYIDAPEYYQNYGKEAKKALEDFIKGKALTYRLVSNEPDKYKRYLIELYANDRNVGKYMVKYGHAWAYTHDKNNLNESYIILQKEAKQKRIGLWKERNPIDPYYIRNPQNRKVK